jgi:antitoxin (DNA-binding transcriptional repressor) of toxin-antitoxin stability system
MEVTITRFRRELFDLVNQAMEGGEIWIAYKGRRFRLSPEDMPAGRLARITPIELRHPDAPRDRGPLLDDMVKAWEHDWDQL